MEGIVLGDHEFSGATAYLAPRQTTRDPYFNVDIELDSLPVARGYAEA
jgi:hypothetical protein